MPQNLTEAQFLEVVRCYENPAYFIHHYCYIQDSVSRNWIPFHLWPAQEDAIYAMRDHQLIAWIKSRQVGASWVAVGYGLWDMIFHAIATVLIFSRRHDEAQYLLGTERLRGMFHRLPDWMKPDVTMDAVNTFGLSNGSIARAFPTGVGDSYNATLAIVDEADLSPNLDMMVTSIKPTIDAGGKLFLIGRVNKREPNSAFKQIYKRARLGQNAYHPIFVPWHAHPDRDQAWYEAQKRDLLTQDDLWEQYPATEDEALAVGFAGRIYPDFDKNNVSEAAEYPGKGAAIYFSCDDGYTDQRVIGLWWIGYADGKPDRVCLFDEVVHTETLFAVSLKEALRKAGVQLPDDIRVEDIAAAVEKHPHIDYMYHDPAAASFGAEARQMGLGTWGAYNKVDDGIKVVRRFVKDGNGERRLLIHPRCTVTIDALANYRTKEESTTGDDPKPIHDIYSHPADMVRYFIASRYLTE